MTRQLATGLNHWLQRHIHQIASTARRSLVLAIGAVTYLVLTSSPAAAAEAHVDTWGAALTVRSAPGLGARPVGSLRDDTPVEITCQVRGDSVTGKFGTSRLWDRLNTGGYVSDAYVFTGSDGQVAPTCRRAAGGHPNKPAPVKKQHATGSTRAAATTGYAIRTSGASVRLRDIPSVGGRVVGHVDDGDTVTIVCTTTSGSRVSDRLGTSAVWDKTTDGAWLSDVYVKTGTSNPVAPECSRGPNTQERKEQDEIDRIRRAANPPAPRIDGLLLPKQFNNPERVTERFREEMRAWWPDGTEEYPLIKEAYGVLLNICDNNSDCYGSDREAYGELDDLYMAHMGKVGLYEHGVGGPIPPSSALGQGLKKWRQARGLPEPPSPAAPQLLPGRYLQKWWGQPINNGFLHQSVPTILKPGTRIDRYGPEGGMFVAPAGTPFPQRSLPASYELRPKAEYELVHPLPVAGGITAPWYGQPGGGVQYLLPSSVGELRAAGILKPVD